MRKPGHCDPGFLQIFEFSNLQIVLIEKGLNANCEIRAVTELHFRIARCVCPGIDIQNAQTNVECSITREEPCESGPGIATQT